MTVATVPAAVAAAITRDSSAAITRDRCTTGADGAITRHCRAAAAITRRRRATAAETRHGCAAAAKACGRSAASAAHGDAALTALELLREAGAGRRDRQKQRDASVGSQHVLLDHR